MPPHSELFEAPLSTSHRRDTQTNGASRPNGTYPKGRRGSLSERLEGFSGGHPAARSESNGSSVESSVLSSTTPRPGGTGGSNGEDEARNRPAQSYSRPTQNGHGTTQRASPGSISRSTTSLLGEKNPTTIPVSPQNIQQSPRKSGDGPSGHPEPTEMSRSSHAHKGPHREVHADPRVEDRGPSVQSLARSSSSHLPSGAPPASSLPTSPPAAIKKASSKMRQTKDTPAGEAERRLGSSATYGGSHVDLRTSPISVPDRVAVTAEPAPRQQSSTPPRIDRSTSRFQQPIQHHTASSESFGSVTASPIPSNLSGGAIRRTGSSHPRHGSDNDGSRADGASVSDTSRSWGGLPPPPTKALPSLRDQPSKKDLVDPSASAEKPSLSTSHDTLARKQAKDGASDGTTRKEGLPSSSITQGRSPKPTSLAAEPTERHGDNLRDPLPQSHPLAVRLVQGDPATKRETSSSTVISREKSQAPIDTRTRTKSPPDRNEHSHPSSPQSPPGQTHTHTDSADIPTRSRGDLIHSESTRPEGAGGGGQTGDGRRHGGGISRKTTEAIHLAPTKASSSLPDQLPNKASTGSASLLDSPAKTSRDMPDNSGDRTTRKEVSDSSFSMQVRPPLSVAESPEAHGAKGNGLQTPPSSFGVRQGQGDPVPKKWSSSILGISRERSQTPTESRTGTKSPPNLSSSPSLSGQPHTHTNSTTYSGAPTKSKVESAHSESMRPEGVGGGGQAGDGGQQGSVSRKAFEAFRPPLAKTLSSSPEKPSNKSLEATGASSLPPTLLDSPAKRSLDMPASSADRTTQKEVSNSNLSTQVRRLEAVSIAAESTGEHGVNVRDPPPPLQSSAVRRGDSNPVSKREPLSGMSISREKSQTATDSRTRIKSPLDRVEISQPSSSPSLSKVPSTRTPPNSTGHSSIPTNTTEPSRLGSVRPDAGDGGKTRDGGPQGGGISKTTAEALPLPTKALSPPPPEQPSNKIDANAHPLTLFDSPPKRPVDMTSSSRKEASDSGPGRQDRRPEPIPPPAAAGPAQGHGVNLGDTLLSPPPPPPHSGVRQGQGDPAAKKEPSSSIGISREKSQTPMESRTRIKSPQDRIEYTHSLSSSSLSRKPSTRPPPGTTADSSIPTRSRAEPSYLESTKPEGPGGRGQTEDREQLGTAPAKPWSSPTEQPSGKTLADPSSNTLPPTLLDSPAKKHRDILGSSSDGTTWKEVSNSSSSMEVRSPKPTLPAAEPTKGHVRDPPLPPHTFAARQGEGEAATKKEPSPSMGISRERSRAAMDSQTRIRSPPDRMEHSPPLTSPNLSRQPSTYRPPNSTTYWGGPASHLESTTPGPGGRGQAGGGDGKGEGDEISPIAAGRDMPIDTRPLRAAADSTHELSSLPVGFSERGRSRNGADSSRHFATPSTSSTVHAPTGMNSTIGVITESLGPVYDPPQAAPPGRPERRPIPSSVPSPHMPNGGRDPNVSLRDLPGGLTGGSPGPLPNGSPHGPPNNFSNGHANGHSGGASGAGASGGSANDSSNHGCCSGCIVM